MRSRTFLHTGVVLACATAASLALAARAAKAPQEALTTADAGASETATPRSGPLVEALGPRKPGKSGARPGKGREKGDRFGH